MITRKGMFGPIVVRDYAGSRDLLLNGQKQGGSFLEPDAELVALGLVGPGPVSSSAYTVGWLMAGACNPTGSALMVGLGSGAGAIQLLYCCPGVDLTVVEIDPAMVTMACENFPLLDHYRDSGRLNIVVGDAEDFLAQRNDRWTFGMADAYNGDPSLIDHYIPKLYEVCDSVWLNMIDELSGPSMKALASALPFTDIWKTTPPRLRVPFTCTSNWIATTQDVDYAKLREFSVFPEFKTASAQWAQEVWKQALGSSLRGLA